MLNVDEKKQKEQQDLQPFYPFDKSTGTFQPKRNYCYWPSSMHRDNLEAEHGVISQSTGMTSDVCTIINGYAGPSKGVSLSSFCIIGAEQSYYRPTYQQIREWNPASYVDQLFRQAVKEFLEGKTIVGLGGKEGQRLFQANRDMNINIEAIPEEKRGIYFDPREPKVSFDGKTWEYLVLVINAKGEAPSKENRAAVEAFNLQQHIANTKAAAKANAEKAKRDKATTTAAAAPVQKPDSDDEDGGTWSLFSMDD